MARKIQLLLKKYAHIWLFEKERIPLVHGKDNLRKLSAPLIVVSNHIRAKDPFALTYAFPNSFLPVHFLGSLRFATPVLFILSWIGIIPLFYKLAGVIPVRQGRGIDANITHALKVLKKGRVVILFPEGKRNFTTEKLLPLRKGAAALAIKSGAPIVPAWIRYAKEVEITFGPSFKLKTDDYAEGTEYIREKLLTLEATRQ